MPNYSQWAITLPNQFAPAGQILEQGSVLQQRQNSQMMEMYRQRLKDQKDDTSANMLSLNKATGDIEKDKTGIEGIDATTHNRVNEVYQKYSKLARQLSPDQYQAALANDLLEVSKWHQGAVTDYGNMLKERDAIMAQHPELDATKVFHTGMDNLAQRYVKQDGSYVPSDQINSTQSLFQNLQNPDELAAHTASTDGIGKFFKGLDKNTINHVNETNKKGFIDKQGYKATSLGDLQQMEFDGEGNPTGNPLKYEASDLKDSNGKPMRMITPELEKAMRGSGLGNQMDKLWMDSKLDVIKNWAVQNRRLPSPSEEEDLKKSFLYSNFSQYVPSNISKNDLAAIPKDRVSNTFVFGNGQQPFNPNTTGTELDRIGELQPLYFPKNGIKIENGVATKDGAPYTTTESHPLLLRAQDVPASLMNVLKSGGYDPDKIRYFDVKIDNGRITAIRPKGKSWVDRQGMYNFQLQNNAEPLKAPQKVYGEPNQPYAPQGNQTHTAPHQESLIDKMRRLKKESENKK